MSRLLVIAFLLNMLNSYAQTFVDDVDGVAIVVINYCVDEKGKVYNEMINQEQTTYKDEDWQLGCLESFKKAKLLYPMKMANDCWRHVYYFVNKKLKNKSLSSNEKLKCKVFHKGKFKYHNLAYINTEIVRRKDRQIEKTEFKDQRQVYKINWVDDHIYTLRTLKLPLEKDKHKIGGLIHVEIIDLVDPNTYMYKSYRKDINDSNVIYGFISKVSD